MGVRDQRRSKPAERGSASGFATSPLGPLFERDDECARLADVVSQAERGAGRVVVIEGPAGIGKTTLVRQLRRLGEAAGMTVLSGRGSELERDFAFGVARQLLEPALARMPREERERVLSGAAGLSGAVLAVAGIETNIALGSDAPHTVLHGLYWLVANLAETRPVLLLIDDAHWSDRGSLSFMQYLAHRLEGLPVLVALAHRTDEPGSALADLRSLGHLGEATSVHLRPLSREATASIVRVMLGDTDDSVIDACQVASGGNPFMITELLEELSTRKAQGFVLEAPDVPTVTTQGIAALVAGRVARLGAEAGALVRALAVLGDGTPLYLAATFAGISQESAGEAADALAGSGVFAPERPLSFLHPLLRSAVYGALGRSERATLHGRAARALSEAGEPAEIFARHLLLSEPGRDEWVVEMLREAARVSLARGAPDVAAAHLERALAEPPKRAGEVQFELGVAKALAGNPEGSEHLTAALEAAGDPIEHAQIGRVLAQSLIPFGRLEDAVRVLDEAIVRLPVEERELRRQLDAEAASAGRMHRSTFAKTTERLRRYSEIPGDTLGERLLLANLAAQQLVAGTARDAVAFARRALDGGLPTSESATFYDALVAALYGDDVDLAERACEAALADASRRGSLRDVSLNIMFRSQIAYRCGRMADAEADAGLALQAALDGGFIFATTAAAFLIDPLIEKGDLAGAADALARAGGTDDVVDTWMTNWLLHARGRLRLASGDVDRGLADLEELGLREARYLGRNPSVYPYRSSSAIALAQRGERAAAHRLAREEIDLAREWGTPRAIGIALRAGGLVEGGNAGIELLAEAVAILAESEARLEHARALVDLGSLLRRTGQRSDARTRLTEGMDLAHRCGAFALADRAREELVVAGARPRRRRTTGREALTSSEHRVASMAADGLKNKEIAEALFVTLRTVETHLGNAFRKLAITSREELAEALKPQ